MAQTGTPIAFVSDENHSALADVAVEFARDGKCVGVTRSSPRGAIYLDLAAGEYRVTLAKDGFGAKRSLARIEPGKPWQFRLLSDSLYGYAWPKWNRAGGASELRVHSPREYRVLLWRYGKTKELVRNVGVFDEHGPRANVQILPDGDFTQTGVEWNRQGFNPSAFRVVAPDRSGLYFFHVETDRGAFASFPWVIAPAKPQAAVAVIASTNTWNAYNNFGGRSNYINPTALPPEPTVNARQDLSRYQTKDVTIWHPPDEAYAPLSFDRPEPFNCIARDVQLDDPIRGRQGCHLTEGEWKLLGWLEREGFDYDLYADAQLHEGALELDAYKVLILSTHPEYWSRDAYARVKRWVDERGGRLMYLGGNGIDCEVELKGDAMRCCTSHRAPAGQVAVDPDSGARYDCRFHRTVESPARLLGVVFTELGAVTSAPYKVVDASHWIFAETGLKNGDVFGEGSLHERCPGGASGHETDKRTENSPADCKVLARGLNAGDGGAEMVYRELKGGGAVFSVGSITWPASILVDRSVSMITRNVLKRFLLVLMMALLLCNLASAATIDETFSSAMVDAAWETHTSSRGTIEVKDGWATFSALPGEQAHVRRANGDDLITVSAWLARWASIYLVWDDRNWCGVGKTLPTPFGRFTSMDVRGGKASEVDHRGIDFNGRHQVRVRLGSDHVAFQYMLDGKWVDLRKIERPKEFAGAPRLIVAGQSYVADDKPFAASGSQIAHFNEKPSGAIDELRIEPTPPAELKLSESEIEAIRHPAPEPVNALLQQNDDDPTFEKIVDFYPPFRRPREIVGVPEHGEEIGVDWLGRLDASPWAPPKAWFFIGETNKSFGETGVPFKRELRNGYLPLVTLTREIDGKPHELTAFGWSDGFSVDGDTHAYVRFRTPQQVTLAWGDGENRRVFNGPVAHLRFKWPQPATVEEISESDFAAKENEYTERWRKRIEPAVRFEIPDARVMNAYRAWVAYSMLNTDTINGLVEPHDGAGFYDSMFGNSVSLHAIAMDQLGLHEYAERILAMQCHFQKPDGLYVQDCGLVDAGGFVAGLATHYELTGDREWLKKVAANIVRQCDWIIEQRKASPKDGMLRGLIKFRPYNDYANPVYNYLGNAWCAQGLKWSAAALKSIDAPQASTYASEADAYRKDILDSMTASKFERDGMTWLDMEPDTHRLLKQAKYTGGDYWGLIASPLLATDILPADDPRTTLIVDMLEKRGGLIAGVCEFHGGIDHAYTFGYLNNALKRGEVRKTLLGFWSFLAFGMTHDTYSPVEVSMIHTGENEATLPHLYSCTEQLRLLRNMLVREDGEVLWLAQGAPRAWLEAGKHLAVTKAPTEFGDVSYRIEPHADGTTKVTIDPPTRKPVGEIRLRLRDPRRRRIVAVEGADNVEFKDDTIVIRNPAAPLALRVKMAGEP